MAATATTTQVLSNATASASSGGTIKTTMMDQITPELVEGPLFLSEYHVRYNVFPAVLKTFLACTILYLCALPIANRILQTENTNADKRRLSYQITNLITNAFMGLLGLYAQYNLLPEDASVPDKIQGLEELAILGSVQIGYQIWSILIGLFFVKETIPMFIHHVCAISASCKVAFLINGFRYFAPLALGMTELSSVPLAIMNAFKNNKSWADAFPTAYILVRLVFSVAFLVIRVYMFVPQHLEYLKLAFLVPYLATEQALWYRLFMFTNWVGAFFLLSLQLYWGYLIVTGMMKFVYDGNHQEVSKVQTKKVD